MQLYATIKFNRPIDLNSDDYLSFGGYQMTINGKSIPFDFFTYYGDIDEEDESIIHIEQFELDEDVTSPEDINYLSSNPINVTEITEFCCYSPNDNPLEISKIIELRLVNDIGEYFVSEEVCNEIEFTYTD